MKTLLEHWDLGQIEETILASIGLIKAGMSKEQVIAAIRIGKKLPDISEREEILSIARARIRGKEKFELSGQMLMNEEDLRFATPDIVADYRGKKLKCRTAAELGCGIGGQSFGIARHCKKVISIDADARKVEYARHNAGIAGLSNITFFTGEILDKDFVKKAESAEHVFCDPSRAESSAERRIEELSPGINQVLHSYSKAKGIGFEVPAQLQVPAGLFGCEREYISIGRKLNRLTLYFGDLKKDFVSVVSLPTEERISRQKEEPSAIKIRPSHCKEYLHVVDTAIMKAGLLPELSYGLSEELFLLHEKKYTLLTSRQDIISPFLESHKVLARTSINGQDILNALKSAQAGTVVLRSSVKPEEYWEERRSFEKELSGDKKLQLFILESEAVVCE